MLLAIATEVVGVYGTCTLTVAIGCCAHLYNYIHYLIAHLIKNMQQLIYWLSDKILCMYHNLLLQYCSQFFSTSSYSPYLHEHQENP